MAKRTITRILQAAGLLFFGVLLALLTLEVALQVGARFVARSGRAELSEFVGGGMHVLSLGDSNTYGLFVERSEAYPQVLEREWNGRGLEPRIEVVNLGFPGVNSSMLLKNLPRLLATLRPDVVTVMVGVNDYWTLPKTTDAGEDAPAVWQTFLWDHSRVYRALHLLRRSIFRAEMEVVEDAGSDLRWHRSRVRLAGESFELGWTQATGSNVPGWTERLRSNLERIADRAAEFGARVIFLTYPADSREYGRANQVIREAVGEMKAPLVDTAAVFAPHCPDDKCPRLLLGDRHPAKAGHRLVADQLRTALEPQ